MSSGDDAVAILTAAGSGTRLGSVGPKALVDVAGTTMLERAARGLAAAGIRAIVVTAHRDALDAFRGILPGSVPGFPDSRVLIVEGGVESRQASVLKGIEAVPAAAFDADVELGSATPVLVCDAARCLTPPSLIHRVIDAIRAGHRAVIPALPVTDTLKQVGVMQPEPGIWDVVATPDRGVLRAVQTPQGFEWDTLVRAHTRGADLAASEDTAATDDAALVEAMGESVVVVDGDEMALKITTPTDLALAQILLDRE